MPRYLVLSAPVVGPAYRYAVSLEQAAEISGLSAEEIQWAIEQTGWASTDVHTVEEVPPMTLGGHDVNIGLSEYHTRRAAHFVAIGDQATGNSAHQPREGFMAPTFRIFVRTAEGAEFQAFTWCRDEASGIARAWREGREFGHNVAAVWAEAV